MADVFVSYKAEDRQRIAPLVQALEMDGLSVWWDAHIGGGDEWRQTILRNLEAAKCVIVVWSKRSVGPNGKFVRDEAGRALKRNTYLPVRIDKVDPPLGFGEMQALDLTGWKADTSDSRYLALVSALRRRGLKPKPAQGGTADREGFDRRTLIAGTSIALAAAAGGTWLFIRPATAKSDSIAVLPFANLSGDSSQSYFSDGIAEELRTALSRIPGLQVVARTSSEAVRDIDAKTAAEKLRVSNILTGSVRRSPQVIRISAQLIDGRSGVERWAEVYDRPPVDALDIQTDIANHVVDALSIRLAAAERAQLEAGGTTNAAAHDLLLQAEASLGKNVDPETLQRLIGMVDAALALDPKYADAVAVKARLLTEKAGTFSRSALEYQQNYAAAEQLARRAIELAPRSRSGYVALAEILDQQLHRRAAFAQFQKMASLPGNDAKTLPDYAIFLAEIGRSAQALQTAEQIVKLDPLNPRSYGTKATVLAHARRFRDALMTVEKAIQLGPQAKPPHALHAYCQAMLGNLEQARREFAAFWPDIADAPQGYVAPLAAADHELGNRLIEHLRKTAGDGAFYQYAEVFAQMNKKDEAVDALARAWSIKDPGLTLTLVDPLLDPLRSDSRFRELLEKLDFPT